MEEYLRLLIDLHKGNYRQGPGGDQETEMAMQLAGLDDERPLQVLDIGCGTGASALLLAEKLNARIRAVDFSEVFLDELVHRAKEKGVLEKIDVFHADMAKLPFQENSFDVIWSEGSVYNIGFENGIQAWRPLLKEGGVLAVSEVTWLAGNPPEELRAFWEREYAEIDTAAGKMAVLERTGYTILGYFVLPESCWLENYYEPLKQRFGGFLERHGNSSTARKVVADHRQEIEWYEKYKRFFSYGFYVAQKTEVWTG